MSVLQGLSKVCSEAITTKGKKAEMLDTNTLMTRVGGGNDQVNLMELVAYLRESKLARKVSGFAEMAAEAEAMKGEFIPV
jgi:chromosome transmission fidelity protein 1